MRSLVCCPQMPLTKAAVRLGMSKRRAKPVSKKKKVVPVVKREAVRPHVLEQLPSPPANAPVVEEEDDEEDDEEEDKKALELKKADDCARSRLRMEEYLLQKFVLEHKRVIDAAVAQYVSESWGQSGAKRRFRDAIYARTGICCLCMSSNNSCNCPSPRGRSRSRSPVPFFSRNRSRSR